jgi:aminoglycoside 2''-phosphotransferase
MTVTADSFAERIRAMAPEVVVHTAVYNGDGLGNDVVIVNGRLVFRFTKAERGQAVMAGELEVLRAIRSRTTLLIPNPFYAGTDAMAYELLAGEQLSYAVLRDLPVGTVETIALQLGEFLRALHGTPTRERLPATRALARLDAWEELRRDTEALIYPLMLPHQREWAKGMFDRVLGDPRQFEDAPRLVHGDLWPEHVLFDRTTGRLSGIIDFGQAGLGDPAGDLGNLLQVYGETFVRRMLPAYPEAARLLPRARCFSHARELEWVLRGLKSGHPFWFGAHLGNARDLVREPAGRPNSATN